MGRFGRCQSDHTLFVKRGGETVTMITVYIDEIVLTGSSEKEMQVLKQYLSIEFEIEDLGELKKNSLT